MTVLLAASLALTGCGAAAAGSAGPPSCPADVPASTGTTLPVPDGPSGAGGDRLVPEQPPAGVLVCEYRSARPGDRDPGLTGQKRLAGDLAPVAADLTLLPRRPGNSSRWACTAAGNRFDAPRYLMALEYPDGGLVWLSTAVDVNACVDTGNGDYVSSVYVADQVQASFAAGRWVPPPAPDGTPDPLDACRDGLLGRLGQEDALVPGEPSTLRICRTTQSYGVRPRTAVTDVEGFGDLVADLNALRTKDSTRGCQGLRGASESWTLLFGYGSGPNVQVQIGDWCDPAVDSGYLQARTSGPDVVPELRRLVASGTGGP